MIEYIILILALIAAIGSIYLIAHMPKTTSPSKPSEKEQHEVNAQYKKDISGNPFDASGNLLLDVEIAPPYATDNIQSVDDYEYNMIFQNEGDRGMTKASRDLLMSQYPMDWTVQPPSSDLFQQGLAAYKESFQNPQDLPMKNPYMAIDGSDMAPPVYKDEKDILATYTPKKPNELTTYDATDAKEIVDKIYGAKGLVADFKKTGDNTYTVMGTRPVNEKVIYEDEAEAEDSIHRDSTHRDSTHRDSSPQVAIHRDGSGNQAPTSSQAVPSAGEHGGYKPQAAFGEGMFTVPATVDNFKVPDPFFTVNPSERARDGKWNYASWTPGLERTFAPTEPQTNWY